MRKLATIIDFNNIAMRAMFTCQYMGDGTIKNFNTNEECEILVRKIATDLSLVLRTFSPDRVIVTCDAREPWRNEIYKDIEDECGQIFMEERGYKFNEAKKAEIFKILMEEKKLPELPYIIDHVSYLDGCKVYLRNGGWVVARFSGTEPLLRIFCEMGTLKEAKTVADIFEEYLGLGK